MRHHHSKPTQFELFGLSDKTTTLTTPDWPNLPTQTRQQITGLMARLLVEHSQEKRTERWEDSSDLAPIKEHGDV